MRIETRILSDEWQADEDFESLSVPVARASTIVFPDAATFESRHARFYDGFSYGLYGTPTTRTLERRIAAISGGTHAILTPSGQSALALALLAFLSAGDHALVPDTIYGSTRSLCRESLTTLGIAVDFYDPLVGAGIGALIRRATRLVVVESPGSNTMEVQDVPAIAAAAHAAGALVLADNTWATGLRFRPFDHGVDIAMEALSKHVGGHGDLLMGALTVRDGAHFRRLKDMARLLGLGVSADDASLALRGLQTMAVRMERSSRSAMEIIRWLRTRPEVGKVLHPAFPDCPGHDHWRRDFLGGSGVFSLLLAEPFSGREATVVDALALFRIGASWGGTHSLVAPHDPTPQRTATRWRAGRLIRFSVGLEDPADLIVDIDQALASLTAPDSTCNRPQSAARSPETSPNPTKERTP